jgi:anti-anti-sigma factor
MEIRKRFSKNIIVFYITGPIDIDSAALIEETGKLLKEGLSRFLLNFANVSIVDYNGLSILAIAYKNIVNQKGVVKFCEVPSHIKELFKAARLDAVFEIHSDEKSALKNFELSNKVDKLPLRRRFKRIDTNISVRFKAGLSSDKALRKGKICNLSGEGLYLYSKETFPVSTELYLEISLGKVKSPLSLMGTVIWLADKELQPHAYPGMGISFTDLANEAQSSIVEFIDKNITRRAKL